MPAISFCTKSPDTQSDDPAIAPGPTGSGKSRLCAELAACWGIGTPAASLYEFDPQVACVSNPAFASPEQAIERLSSVGACLPTQIRRQTSPQGHWLRSRSYHSLPPRRLPGLNSVPLWCRSPLFLSEGQRARFKLALLLQPELVQRLRGCIIDGLGEGIQARRTVFSPYQSLTQLLWRVALLMY